jgi:hypothetical protein
MHIPFCLIVLFCVLFVFYALFVFCVLFVCECVLDTCHRDIGTIFDYPN